MRRKAKHYTLEFKQKAVELSYAKGSVAQVCNCKLPHTGTA